LTGRACSLGSCLWRLQSDAAASARLGCTGEVEKSQGLIRRGSIFPFSPENSLRW